MADEPEVQAEDEAPPKKKSKDRQNMFSFVVL